MTPRTIRYLPLLILALLVSTGCRDAVVEPESGDGPLPDLSPDVVGAWAGIYDGTLGLVGTSVIVRDTFRLGFDVERIGAEFAYRGDVRWTEAEREYRYECVPAPLIVTNERRLRFDCVQRSQLDSTLVLRVEATADSDYRVLRGTVRDAGGSGAAYDVELRRSAR